MKRWEVLPERFIEELDIFLPKDKKEVVLESFRKKHPTTFRVNTLKIDKPTLLESLTSLGIEVEEVPWYQDALILKNVPQKILTESDIYKNGYIYVQSLSSMIPALVINPSKGETILDLTAAPGSKTTQLAALMKNTGHIVANDKSRARMFKLEANLSLQGVANTIISILPGEFLWRKYPEHFDKTLVDVPCSMEGRFFTEDEKTYADWSITKVKQLSQLQKWLLRSAISMTRVGGIIVYSTCTLSPQENEEVIDWIVKKERFAIELEDITIPNLPTQPGLTHYKQRLFDNRLTKTIRIYPSNTMEGFFVAKLKKVASTIR